jgi:hypothetical protein
MTQLCIIKLVLVLVLVLACPCGMWFAPALGASVGGVKVSERDCDPGHGEHWKTDDCLRFTLVSLEALSVRASLG